MKPKTAMTKEKQLDHWIQYYLQAKSDGNAKLTKAYLALILKCGGTIPKL